MFACTWIREMCEREVQHFILSIYCSVRTILYTAAVLNFIAGPCFVLNKVQFIILFLNATERQIPLFTSLEHIYMFV